MLNLIGLVYFLIVPDHIATTRKVVAAPNYTIHIRQLTEGERVVQKSIAEAGTVINAASALNLQRDALGDMDSWIVRPAKGGEVQILWIDWVAIIERGEAATNFQINNGDRLFFQARFPKVARRRPSN